MNVECLLLDQRKKMEIMNFVPSSDTIYELASFFQNLSDITRLRIITCLSISDMCVSDLSNLLKINQTTVSHQLKLLRDNKLVKYKRVGKILLYSLATKQVNEVLLSGVDLLN